MNTGEIVTEIPLPTNSLAITCGRSFIREYAEITASGVPWLDYEGYECIFNYSDIDPGFFTLPTCPVSKEDFKNCVCFIKMQGEMIKFKKRENFLEEKISESEFWELFNTDTELHKS